MLDSVAMVGRYATLAAALLVASISGAGATTLLKEAREPRTVVVGISNETLCGYMESDWTATGVIVEVLRAALEPMGSKRSWQM